MPPYHAAALTRELRACHLRVHARMESDDHTVVLERQPVVAMRFGPPHLRGARDGLPLAKNIGLERAVRGGTEESIGPKTTRIRGP